MQLKLHPRQVDNKEDKIISRRRRLSGDCDTGPAMKHLLICMLIICIAHLAASTDKDGKDFNTRENEKVKQMTKNDAMRVADKALGDKDGWAVDGGASVKTRQWAVSAGKTVYESDNKMAKLAVGVAAHGRDGKVNDKQVGASFSWKF